MKRAFVVGFALVVLNACGRSKVTPSGTGGSGGSVAPTQDAADSTDGGAPDAQVPDGLDAHDAADVADRPDVPLTDVPNATDASDAADVLPVDVPAAVDVAPVDVPAAVDVAPVDLPVAEVAPDVANDGGDGGGADRTDDAISGDGNALVLCTGVTTLAQACSRYCNALDIACTGANSQYPGADQDAQFDACLAACMPQRWSCGQPSDTTGNTVYCRRNRAIAAEDAFNASASTLQTDCQQAGPNSPSCI